MEPKTGTIKSVDLILFNGRLFTADPKRPSAEALAISGDRISAIGTTEEVFGLSSPNTQCIDLKNHVAVPGFNDAHYHSGMSALSGYTLSFESMDPTWQETQDALMHAAQQIPPSTWILGTIGGTVVTDGGADRFALDRFAPNHPILLQSLGPWAIVNTKAMAFLGIGDQEPDPIGGYYERLPGSRQVNGKIFGYAYLGPYKGHLMASIPKTDLISQLQAIANEAVRYGITSIQDMPFIAAEKYIRLLQEVQFPVRVRLIRFPITTADCRDTMEGRNLPLHPPGQPLVTVLGTKWILDGTPFEWGAALRGEYLDRPGWSGKTYFSESEIVSMVRETLQWEDQLLVHCAGDQPVETLFDTMEQFSDVDWARKRVRIEHGDGVAGKLLERALRLGTIVVLNPTHFSLAELVAQRYGSHTHFYAQRTLLEAGVPLAFGSDGPMNPGLNIMFAVSHPVHPEEAISREQAVEAYTRGSEFAEFAEEEKGTLSIGKLADIAVLSQDIFSVPVEALPATESILTLVGGNIVYDAKMLN